MIGNLLQVLLLFVLLVFCFRYARRAEDNICIIFTALSFATLLISTLYYLAHTYLREGMRVPFAANDIADFGTFLLMGTALSTVVGSGKGRLRAVTAASALFAAANIALWIGWSGEWVRDIFGGLAFGWFICVCFRSLYLTDAVSRKERAALWTVCAVLIAVQTATFFVPASAKTLLDMAATALMALGEVWLLARTLMALKPGRSFEKALSLSFTGFLWGSVSMYMSAGIPYEVFSNLITAQLLLILLTLRKKVKGT